jgi:hypothetical protein
MRKPCSRFALVFVAFILSFVLVCPEIATADPIVVDQISPIGVEGMTGLGCCIDADWAQTFTVGIAGILRTVALPLSTPLAFPGTEDFSGQLRIQLRPTLGGAPGDSVFAEMLLTKSSLPSANDPAVRSEFTTFFSGLNIPVILGEQLAIVFSNLGHNGQNIRLATNGTASYTGGAPYRQPRQDTGMAGDQGNVTGPWQRPICCQEFDFAFFTSVEPATLAATPEPGTILLLGTGVLWVARRRGRAAQGRDRRWDSAENLERRTPKRNGGMAVAARCGRC